MNIIGIDPGISGAIASYNGKELLVYDMPVFSIEKNGKMRNQIDIMRFIGMLRHEKPDHVFLEKVGAMPGNGSGAMFSFGFGCGLLEGAIAACGLAYTYITPMKWKKAMGCPADKDAARMRASQLLPQYAHNWERKKDDGRAESSLLALYGYQLNIPHITPSAQQVKG